MTKTTASSLSTLYWGGFDQSEIDAMQQFLRQVDGVTIAASYTDYDIPFWSQWTCFGGQSNTLKVGHNKEGQIEAFCLNAVGELWHLTQSSWTLIHGGFNNQVLSLNNDKDGNLHLFCIDHTGTCWTIAQTGNGSWSNWTSLGGPYTQLCAGRNEDGRIELFSLNTTGELWHTWQTHPDGDWSPWAHLPANTPWTTIAVNNNEDGRLEVFCLNPEGELWHAWQHSPNGGWNSEWASRGGQSSHIAVGRNIDGRLEVFALNNGDLYRIWQTSPNGGWSGEWALEGGNSTHATGLLKDIKVISQHNGSIECFCLNEGGDTWRKWQGGSNPFNSTWGDWERLNSYMSTLEVIKNNNGQIEVFALGYDGQLYHRAQLQTGEQPLRDEDIQHFIQTQQAAGHIQSNGDPILVFLKSLGPDNDNSYHNQHYTVIPQPRPGYPDHDTWPHVVLKVLPQD